MNSHIMNSTALNDKQLSTSHTVPLLKVLVFSIEKINLAVRIESVYKVINSTPIYGSGLNGVGIIHMGDCEVTVLDLQMRLLQSSRIQENLKEGYLIVIQNPKGELYGIPVETVPALMDIPLHTIRVLPEPFRQADTLGIASHVAVIPEAETTLTLFLLDTTKLALS